MELTYKAFVVNEVSGRYPTALQLKDIDSLPPGEVLIEVKYSSLNYKDALSASGAKFITNSYPHTTGIDAAGIVLTSKSDQFLAGQQVIVTGFDLGMNSDGGHAEYIRVPAAWVVPLPKDLTLKEAMIIGTAGFTAGLSVMEVLKRGIKPEDGPIAVSGSSGGVGSLAVKILTKLGYEVHALSMSMDVAGYLHNLGAKRVILPDEFLRPEDKGVQLLEPEYAAVIDSVGGQVLSNLIKKLKYGGVATTCGLVNGIDLDLTIFAFINRGIQVSGIDSVWIPMEKRIPVWNHFATDWKMPIDESMYTTFSLDELPAYMAKILAGEMKGRGIIKI